MKGVEATVSCKDFGVGTSTVPNAAPLPWMDECLRCVLCASGCIMFRSEGLALSVLLTLEEPACAGKYSSQQPPVSMAVCFREASFFKFEKRK